MTTLEQLESLLARLPKRYPMLLVDRLLECVPGQSAQGLKCVTYNEPFFQGHFPDYPVMPGVLLLEALVQLSTLLSHASGRGVPDGVRSIDGARFKRQVLPGDQVILETRMEGDGRFAVQAVVDGEVAAEARLVLGTHGTPG